MVVYVPKRATSGDASLAPPDDAIRTYVDGKGGPGHLSVLLSRESERYVEEWPFVKVSIDLPNGGRHINVITLERSRNKSDYRVRKNKRVKKRKFIDVPRVGGLRNLEDINAWDVVDSDYVSTSKIVLTTIVRRVRSIS